MLSEPPETDTSLSTKSDAASERVKVIVELSPAPKELSTSSSLMAIVGLSLSKINAVSVILPTAIVADCVASGMASSVVGMTTTKSVALRDFWKKRKKKNYCQNAVGNKIVEIT